ncbi:MAG: hypothetical protein IKE38_06190 [Erysipelotrichaceae bacterium]|nr:hypothetical protein [Erysipelotrichaceae bacterium]
MKQYLEFFIDGYHEWTNSGKMPYLASFEFSYYLKQKAQRLKEKGLAISENFEHVEDEIAGTVSRQGSPISAETVYREARHVLIYRRGEEVIKAYRHPVTIYATILNKEGYEDREAVCTGCGHSSLVSVLRKGCPYCGACYEGEEAYPCVASFYSVPAVAERKKLEKDIRKITLIPAVLFFLFVSIAVIFTDAESPWWFRILKGLFMGLFCGGIGAFLSYMGYSLSLLIRLFFEAGRSLPLLRGLSSRKKMEAKMKPYDPDFSYEYFEGRMIMLLRDIAFSAKRDDLSFYEGKEDLSFLDDIVDLSYRGSSALRHFEVKDDQIIITMEAFMSIITMKDRLSRKDKNYTITLRKKKDASSAVIDLCQVRCHNCGSSFDAMHKKVCPYCGSEYELINDDWIITSIRD